MKQELIVLIKNRFKKILVPMDGSANSIRGLNEAISLARLGHSEVIALHVLPLLPQNITKTYDAYIIHLGQLAHKLLDKARTTAAQNGIKLREKILYGNDTVKVITDYAKTTKSGVVVIGSRGKGNPKAPYLGSIANGVLFTSKIPVLVVK